MAKFKIVDEHLCESQIDFINTITHKRFSAKEVIPKIVSYFRDHPTRNEEILPLVKAIIPYLVYQQSSLNFYDLLVIAFYLGSAYKQLGWPKELQDKINKKYPALTDRKSTRLNSSHTDISRMPSSA